MHLVFPLCVACLLWLNCKAHAALRCQQAACCRRSELAGLQELRPLVYPLAQVLLGTVRLVPTPRYFPLRLRCLRALLALGKAVGHFIPLSPLLLEMLQVHSSRLALQGPRPQPKATSLIVWQQFRFNSKALSASRLEVHHSGCSTQSPT